MNEKGSEALRVDEEKMGMVVHTFNPNTWEAESGGFLNSRPAWPTEWAPGQPGLHRETLSQKTKTKTKTNKQQKRMNSLCLIA